MVQLFTGTISYEQGQQKPPVLKQFRLDKSRRRVYLIMHTKFFTNYLCHDYRCGTPIKVQKGLAGKTVKPPEMKGISTGFLYI
jgi:hypothetical protein